MAVALHAADDRAVEHAERGEQRGGAVPLVIVCQVWQRPGLSGSPGWVRSSAWIWLFSSSDSTRRRRRVNVEPNDVGELGGKAEIPRALEGA